MAILKFMLGVNGFAGIYFLTNLFGEFLIISHRRINFVGNFELPVYYSTARNSVLNRMAESTLCCGHGLRIHPLSSADTEHLLPRRSTCY